MSEPINNPVPEGYNHVSPYLSVMDVKKELEFIQQVFGGIIKEQLKLPDGSVSHSEIYIGDSLIMMGKTRAGELATQSMLYVFVADCDYTYKKGIEAGASSIVEPADQFYGDRSAGFIDPSGIQWYVATRIEKLSQEEMRRRMNELYK
jgi:uncharacterized glyoxalase superfamily protein PhnB